MNDFLRRFSMGFGLGVGVGTPANVLRGVRSAIDDDFGTIFRTLRHDEGMMSALGYAGQTGLGAVRGGFGAFGNVLRAIPAGFGTVPGLGGTMGYGLGVGLMTGGPVLAGAAAFSGLNNIRRGRYGRAALQLALGAGLVGAMYGAHLRAVS